MYTFLVFCGRMRRDARRTHECGNPTPAACWLGAWQLLLVDDGSTDDSTAIALRYADAHPERIRYLAHPDRENRGASASRNLGARHARGEYLAYLDAADRAVALLGHPGVAGAWGRPSALAEMTVGGLAGHLAYQIFSVGPALEDYRDTDVVAAFMRRLDARGGGADRQRASAALHGALTGVVDDLVALTAINTERT